MAQPNRGDAKRLVQSWSGGDKGTLGELVPFAFPELRALADARDHRASKRGGGNKVALEEGAAVVEQRRVDFVALNGALEDRAQLDPRQSRGVEVRFFGGLTEDEIAVVLGVSAVAGKRDWRTARTFLRCRPGADVMSQGGTAVTPERWRQVKELMEAVWDLDASERREFLDQACSGDPELRSDVEDMLACDRNAGEFLAVPAGGLSAIGESTATDAIHTALNSNQSFGPYRTLRVLGEGGMGIVYLAEQRDPIQRRVALKVVKPGMDSKEVIARFESERQALALMDHPNIARVLDAGSAAGRPYFVMEYVPGLPITDYCDQNRLSSRERLVLFCQICQTIHHAHQKGVIHRDIKPSNILVEVIDGKPVPKVIDFGVAKAMNQRLTEKTLFTQMGMLMGTPAYMSPEQAGLGGLDVDTTTDIYSLGVLLYQLLVGALPFDPSEMREAGYAEICRVIREEEPPKPTTKLEKLGATSTEVARRRQTDARTLIKEVRGDLEWITMKAIEKDRRRRYASASEMAADVLRHLRNEPVLAGPQSTMYRLRKIVRKNRGVVIAAALILACLLAGLGVSSAMYFRSERQRAQAEAKGYFGSLSAADAHLRANDVTSAEESLLQVDPHMRGWEWRHLYRQLDPSLLTIYAYHLSSDISSLTVSDDGSRIVWGTREIVHVWDGTTYSRIAEYGGLGTVVAVNGGGTLLLSKDKPTFIKGTGWTHPFRVIEVASGREVTAIIETPIPAEVNNSVSAFSADGKRVAIGWEDGVLRVWDIASSQVVFAATAAGSKIRSLAFSPTGAQVASGAQDGILRVWDLSSGRLASTMQGHGGPVMALAFSAEGARVVSGSMDQTVRIWDSKTGVALATLTGHQGPVLAVSFSRDGRRVASGSTDKYVRVWDADRNNALATLTGNDYPVNAVTFNKDGTKVLSASTGILVRVWNAPPGQAPAVPTTGQAVRFNPLVSLYGDRVFSETGLRGNEVIDVRSGRKVCEWQEDRVSTVAAVSPQGHRVLAGLEVRDATTCTHLATLHGQSDPTSAAFSGDGTRIVAARYPHLLEMWDAATGSKVWSTALRDERSAVAFSPDANRVVSSSGDPAGYSDWTLESFVEIRSADSSKTVATMKDSRGVVLALAFSPDGKRVAAGYLDGKIQVWNVSKGERPAVLRGHTGPVTGIAFNPDGSRLASGSRDSTVRIWDVVRYEPLLTLRGHTSGVTGMAFSPDGSHLTSVDRNVGIRTWEATPVYLVEARELVRSLFRKTSLTADVLLSLQRDTTLDSSVRQAAIQIADAVGDDPLALNQQSWNVIKAPGASAEAYRKALQRAETCQHLRPWRTAYLTTLGAAQYRTGAYKLALETLTRATEANLGRPPFDAAFLAMTLQPMGRGNDAHSALERLRILSKDSQDSLGNWRDRDLQTCVREAEQVVGGKAN